MDKERLNKSDVLAIIDEVMNNREIDSIRNAVLAIRDKVLEAVPVHERIHGKWKSSEDGNLHYCSKCGWALNEAGAPLDMGVDYWGPHDTGVWITGWDSDLMNYCPQCGAKMREEEEFEKQLEKIRQKLYPGK